MADLKARIYTWEDLSHTDAAFLLDRSVDKTGIQKKLACVLGLVKDREEEKDGERGGDSSKDKRSLIVLDLFYHCILFARRQSLRTDQLSGLFSIVRSLHNACVSSPYDNSTACFKFFTELMICHSINRPPYSTALFTMEQVKSITDYVLLTYFKHFKLYKYAFTKRVILRLKVQYEGEEEEELEEEGGEKELDVPTQTEKEEVEITETEKEGTEEKRDSEDETKGMSNFSRCILTLMMCFPSSHSSLGEEGEKSLTPEQQLLRNLISSSLADHLKQMEVIILCCIH